jgi:hypothetical protein
MGLRRQISQFVRDRPLLWTTLNPPYYRVRTQAQTMRMRLRYGQGYEPDWSAGNEIIRGLLRAGKACGIAKVGSLEAEAVQLYLRRAAGAQWDPILRRQMLDNVGIFPPTDPFLDGFCRDYLQALPSISVLGVLGGPGERELLSQPGAPNRFIRWQSLEPWYFDDPWTAELAGRRVVVVHPFADTIQAQYRRRTEVWDNPKLLPDFDLRTVKMPLSAGLVPSHYPDWRAQFDALIAEVDSAPFDVMLVGAGGVSLLFVAHAAKTGRIGVHLGGGTQVLFGIQSRRFDKDPLIMKRMNASWTRPSAAETPETRVKVEQGCYW